MHVIYTICNGLLNRTPYFISTLSIKKANHKKQQQNKPQKIDVDMLQ